MAHPLTGAAPAGDEPWGAVGSGAGGSGAVGSGDGGSGDGGSGDGGSGDGGSGDGGSGDGGSGDGAASARPQRLSMRRTAVLFVRMRLRFLRNAFRGGAKTIVPTLLGYLGSAMLLAVGLAGSAGLHGEPADRATVIAVVAASVAALAALVGPVLIAGVDDSLSPERLAPYPLTRARRVVGLFAAATVSPIAVVTLVVLLVAAVGRSRTMLGTAVAIAAAVLLWTELVVLTRLLATVMARLVQSRRGKDLTMVLGALVGVSGWLWSQLAQVLGRVPFARVEGVARALRWTPPGALGRAIVEGGAGHVATAAAGLVLGLAGLALAAAAWWSALGRAAEPATTARVTTSPAASAATNAGAAAAAGGAGGAGGAPAGGAGLAPAGGAPAGGVVAGGVVAGGAPAGGRHGAGIFDGLLGRLPRTIVGAVAARDLRYLVRHPRQRVSVATLVCVAVVVPLLNARRATHAPEVTLFGTSAALLGTLGSLNQIGVEGRALWIHLTSGIAPRDYLRGKNLALAAYMLPLVVLSSTLLALMTHGWRYLPAALLAGAGALFAGMGVGNLCSVLVPVPVAEGSNPFANSTGGQGCATGMLMVVWSFLALVVVSPVMIALFVVRGRPIACAVVGVVAVGYGTIAWRIGSAMAAARLRGREPEMQQAVTPAG